MKINELNKHFKDVKIKELNKKSQARVVVLLAVGYATPYFLTVCLNINIAQMGLRVLFILF